MKKNSFSYDELISCGNGELFGPGNAKLPLPPMLMFDRITEIRENAGEFKKGQIKADLKIKDDLWFFNCHFKEDPVMPGCLGLDAMWQLVGFYLGWIGKPGKGRALGASSVKFTGEVLNTAKIARYQIDMKKILKNFEIFENFLGSEIFEISRFSMITLLFYLYCTNSHYPPPLEGGAAGPAGPPESSPRAHACPGCPRRPPEHF